MGPLLTPPETNNSVGAIFFYMSNSYYIIIDVFAFY